jgi:hypothetical protein
VRKQGSPRSDASGYVRRQAAPCSGADRGGIIEEDKLQKDLDELAGPEFLAEVRRVQPLYAAMVKSMLRRTEGSGQNLLEHARTIQRAIVDYATKVSATVDDDEPETAEVARAALRPIEQYRLNAARRSASADETTAAAPNPAPAEPAKTP